MHIFVVLLGGVLIGLMLFWQFRRDRQSGMISTSRFEREIGADEFEQMVLATSAEVPVLVNFYATWCGPCHSFAPVTAAMVRQYEGAFLLARINYDKNPQLVSKYEISCVPTTLLFRHGEKVDGFEGAQLAHQLRYFLAKNGITQPVTSG